MNALVTDHHDTPATTPAWSSPVDPQTGLASCLYRGWVRHRRHAPVAHEFRYGVNLVYLDLEEIDRVFEGRWLWSTRRRLAVARFVRDDYLGDPAVPLDVAVRDLVEERLGRRVEGAIRLLTHPRYLGFVMNPVSFYFCHSAASGEVEAIVAEITNTPWGERHSYVLDARAAGDGRTRRFRFAKEFHISPFMPMEQEYEWSFVLPADRMAVHMVNLDHGEPVFDADMSLQRRPLSGRELARALARHPLMTGEVLAGIYWQALRLWMKRCTFHPHPGTLDLEARNTP